MALRAETLHVQIDAARQRLAALQRRAEQASGQTPAIVLQTLGELEAAIGELLSAQQDLSAHRDELATVRRQLEGERRKYWEFFDTAGEAYLVTTPDADIIEANRAAAELFNISQRFLVGKNFSVFVSTDRARVMTQARRLSELGGAAEWVFNVRPRERAPFEVTCRVLASRSADRTLRWLVRRRTMRASSRP